MQRSEELRQSTPWAVGLKEPSGERGWKRVILARFRHEEDARPYWNGKRVIYPEPVYLWHGGKVVAKSL